MLKYLDKIILFFDRQISLFWMSYEKRGIVLSLMIHLLILTVVMVLSFVPKQSVKKLRLIKIDSAISSKNEVGDIQLPGKVEVPFSGTTNIDSTKIKNISDSSGISFNADTLLTDYSYSEESLNISMIFPDDWQFVDNKVKESLDAIIFFPKPGTKYSQKLSVTIQTDPGGLMFNSSGFDSSGTVSNMEFFYGSPVQTYDQIEQIVYVKAKNINENFLIRLICSIEEYRQFKPTFYLMVGSFKTG